MGRLPGRAVGSFYGTFDQGGNVWEWNDTIVLHFGGTRGLRGGSFDGSDSGPAVLEPHSRPIRPGEKTAFGFRVSSLAPIP